MTKFNGKPNLFKTAIAVPNPEVIIPSNKGNNKDQLYFGAQLDTLAAIRALTKSLEAAGVTTEETIKNATLNAYVDASIKAGKRVANFKGVGDISEASCEVRRKSSRSPLSDLDAAILNENHIPMEKVVVTEKIPQRYFFNPAIIADEALAEKITAALSTVKELKGQDIILEQPARAEVCNSIVTESAFDAAAKIKNKAVAQKIVSIISTISVKTTLKTQDFDTIINLIRKAGIKL